jgi:hypothetical protein
MHHRTAASTRGVPTGAWLGRIKRTRPGTTGRSTIKPIPRDDRFVTQPWHGTSSGPSRCARTNLPYRRNAIRRPRGSGSVGCQCSDVLPIGKGWKSCILVAAEGKERRQTACTTRANPAKLAAAVQQNVNQSGDMAAPPRFLRAKKKADVAAYPKVPRHAGLLANGPPGLAGLPLI